MSSQQPYADISGIDWMISYIRWKSRHLPSGGNNFSVVADVSDTFCYESFENRISQLKNIKSFLSGRIKRDLSAWRPRWYYNEKNCAGIVCSIDRDAEKLEITNELPEGTALKTVYFEQTKQLLFTFSHSIFDGVGAEKLISALTDTQISDEVPERKIPIDVHAMKTNGRELQKLMAQIPEKKILRMPETYSVCKNEFRTISLDQKEFHTLEENVEKKYGPFSLSLFILALILCSLEENVLPAAPEKEYIFIPMSVDLRNSNKEKNNIFFNHWSLMPLLVTRDVLKKGITAAIPHLRLLYTKGLANRTPNLFFNASEAMKYIPRRLIDIFVKATPAKTLGTLMFSFLNSDHCRKEMIGNLAHYPDMPYGNNLGFFVNTYNGKLNIIISRRPWQDDGAFEHFCNKIQLQLQEEIR